MAIAEYKVTGSDFSGWKVTGRMQDGREFDITPSGPLTAKEAQSLCEAIVVAFRITPGQDLIQRIGADLRAGLLRSNR